MSKRPFGSVLQHMCRTFRAQGEGAPSDAHLLEQWRTQQDEIAFELLLRRHGPMVFGLCSRLLHQNQDAEDAFQATFLVLVRKAGSINKQTSLGSWLYKVAYRIALRIRNKPAPQTKPIDPQSIAQDRQAQDEVVWKDLRPVLDDEICRLPQHYREAFVLCCIQGKTNEEAAREIGCPVGTVLSRLSRARAQLRNRLGRRGVGLSAAALTALLSQNGLTATIPAKLIGGTIMNAAVDAGLNGFANQAVPETIASLTQGVIKTMYMTKIKIAASILLIAGLLCTGGGFLAQHTVLGQQPAKGDAAGVRETILVPATQWKEIVDWEWTDSRWDSVAFSPNGKWLATGTKDGIIHFWSPNTGDEAKSLNSQTKKVTALAFSPDGNLLASGSTTGVITLLDVHSGKQLIRLESNKTVRNLAFTPDGKTIAAKDGKLIELWHLPTGKKVGQVKLNAADLKVLNLDTEIRWWDPQKGKKLTPEARIPKTIYLYTLSPSGKIIAAAEGQGDITLWDAATGKKLRVFRAHTGKVIALRFSPDGRLLASGGKDATIRLWDVKSGKQILKGVHEAPVQEIAISPDGKLIISTGQDKKIKVWRPTTIKIRSDVEYRLSTTPKRLTDLVQDLVRRKKSNAECIEAIFLATLGRFPTETEVQLLGTQLKMTKANRQQKLRELLATLTHSKEFRSHVEALQAGNAAGLFHYYLEKEWKKSGK